MVDGGCGYFLVSQRIERIGTQAAYQVSLGTRVSGGNPITISGHDLSGATIKVGGNTADSIIITVPSGTAGPSSVVLTTAGGTATDAGAYTYVVAPTISLVSPNTGSAAGGDNVTITGTGFTGATSVTFDGVSDQSFTILSNSEITAVTPTGSSGSAKDVSVTTPSGTGTGTGVFTYEEFVLTNNGTEGPLNFTAGSTINDLMPVTQLMEAGKSLSNTTIVFDLGTGFTATTSNLYQTKTGGTFSGWQHLTSGMNTNGGRTVTITGVNLTSQYDLAAIDLCSQAVPEQGTYMITATINGGTPLTLIINSN